jgi:FAD/FMN-containing dehydrogenase
MGPLRPASRRSFVKGLAASAGTLVLGFDPVRRTWVTSAFADSPVVSIPDLDGVLLTDPATLGVFGDDFGHLVHHTPIAVLKPGSVEDVVRAVRFCRAHQIPVAARGQGHSTAGQSQVLGGLVIDSSTLGAIEKIADNFVVVQAGCTWKDLVTATVPLGVQPPVLTGFVGLSIGGTLSNGGIGAACFLRGAQVNNVLELEVVTGEGTLRRCSRRENPLLFEAVLGGVGQYAIIVRARLPLSPVLPEARNYVINYTDATQFFDAMGTLTSAAKMDGVYAVIVPNQAGGWIYQINANKFFAPGQPPDDTALLAGVAFPAPALQTTDYDTVSFDTLVDSQIAFLQSIGLNDVPHVWGDVFLPASQTPAFIQSSLAALTPADLGPAGFVLLFPVRNVSFDDDGVSGSGDERAPTPLAFRLPRERNVFLFDVLTQGFFGDPNYAPTQLAKTRARFEAARAVGGTLYPIGSTPMSKTDWAVQYGVAYPLLLTAKRTFDPAGILTPGPGIF